MGTHNNSNSRKAVEIFGRIGEQKAIAQLNASDLPPVRVRHIRKLHTKTIRGLAFQAARRSITGAFLSILGLLFQCAKLGWKVMNANRALMLGLFISVLFNFIMTSKDTWGWWKERTASRYMARMGVTPNPVMGRSVWNSDLNGWIDGTQGNWSSFGSSAQVSSSPCASKFQSLLAQTDPSHGAYNLNLDHSPLSTRTTVARLQKTRHRYGTYRHDLLVALGAVERMEQETIHAEFESWAHAEAGRCRQMQKVLAKQKKKLKGKTANQTAIDLEVLGIDNYCDSCAADAEGKVTY